MSETTIKTNALYEKIKTLLKTIPDFVTEENELRYNKIKEAAENGNPVLIEPLLKDEKIKAAFFSPIKSQRTSRLSKILNSWQSKLLLQVTLVCIFQSSFVHQNPFCR